ncbi:NAD-dependent epimerase/dehydratase family protein [Robiginitalea aurantiaca]|uniref:NAD-dependent epimerase/dehydratase family protein n=1 Tax=Robiginitalea aurantiaca TaxID=3056915 RepID=A0ABT7WEP3_9FLAO|nr:NAD-dependent epimerase/dehydratase family protein [Robiginitalea aurantiaca]MDM9631382.1 NAD-dependent epimerase/dehydratase family protein [Robiginitalea aurantiaca]
MVFVTGGTGLVGSHLLMRLLQRGLKPRALRRPESDLKKIADLFELYGPKTTALFEDIEWVSGDLNDLPSLEIALKGVTEVYHCAALISFNPGDRDALRRVNHEGTRNIVNLCLNRGIKRLYYCSSIATIGGIKAIKTEEDLWDPTDTNVYATSKYLAEMEVWRGGQEGLETVIVNPGVIFGPGFWDRGSAKFFTKTAPGLKYSPPGGTGFIGVMDVVQAFETLIEKQCFNQRYILVAENLKFGEVLSQIAGHLQVAPPARILKTWQLEWLWRLDWFRSILSGGPRKLTRDTARSLKSINTYSSEKIIGHTGFQFEPIGEVLRECSLHFIKWDKGNHS